tara:strand:+ start:4318 stop:4737 length:420 start_codon:yes stop_codon:yes gene_type:complete
MAIMATRLAALIVAGAGSWFGVVAIQAWCAPFAGAAFTDVLACGQVATALIVLTCLSMVLPSSIVGAQYLEGRDMRSIDASPLISYALIATAIGVLFVDAGAYRSLGFGASAAFYPGLASAISHGLINAAYISFLNRGR